MSTQFSAAPQALGYLYQARHALHLLLTEEEETALSIERFDDVAFEKDGTPQELLQLKHHLGSGAPLTDASSDLWKTIRVWSTQYLCRQLEPATSKLSIITTSQAPDDSIAALLRPDSQRNPAMASIRLSEVASGSTNKNLQPAFDAFQALSKQDREMLVASIYVLDGSPNIIDTGSKIKRRLELTVRKEHVDGLYERLEGWWFEKVVRHLAGSSIDPIRRDEVLSKVLDIADGYKPDALPIDFLDAEPATVPDPDADNRMFVRQLRAITVRNKRIENAIRDYYRAYEQRSRWVREDLIVGDELERYERRLIDEWERLCLAILDREDIPDTDEEEIQRCGRLIYEWMEFTANFPIRPLVTEPYVMRGSYHILANEDKPRVWWHPKFLERLQVLLAVPAGGAL